MKGDPVALLHGLVEIQSLSGREQAAVSYLVDQMAALGMEAAADGSGSAVGLRQRPDEDGRIDQEIVLLGHIDTVSGEVPVRVEGGALYGRGTVDAKGPLATLALAAARADVQPGTRLVVIGAVEEEAATSKGAHYAVDRYRPACCVIGEPSGWDAVTLGYKGRLRLHYSLRRPGGHTAGPARSAAEEAVAWWNALGDEIARRNAGRERLFDQILTNLSDISTASDGLTSRVQANVGLRLPPGVDVAELEATIRRLAGDADIATEAYEPAFQSDRSTLLAAAFAKALRQKGCQPRFKLKTGTSDMNVVGPAWGCPIVAYGPGDSTLDHTPDEHVLIDDYLRAIDVLTQALNTVQSRARALRPAAAGGSYEPG